MPERYCQRPDCGRLIPSRKRRDARWCSRSCESKARRAARRRAAFESANPDAAELLRTEDQSLGELHERARPPAHWADDPRQYSDYGELPDDYDVAAEIDAGHQDDDADEQTSHFRSMLDADRTPAATWKRWRAYGRRHGTEHPEQTADRIERHRAAEAAKMARLDSSTAGRIQDRFDTRTSANVAASAAESRRLNARHAEQPPVPSPGFDFQGESVSGGPYRQGRAPGIRSGHADYAWNMQDGWVHTGF